MDERSSVILSGLAGGGTAEHAGAVVAENPAAYPEIDRFGPRLPAYEVFARHVRGLTLKNVRLKLAAPDLRPALVCQDVLGLTASDGSVPQAKDPESLVRLEQSPRAIIERFDASGANDPPTTR